MHSFLTLTVGAFIGVRRLMQCAKTLLCLCPSLGGFAEGQSAHEQFSSSCHYSNSHSPLVKGAINWHIRHKAVKANFRTLNPTWLHIGFSKIQDQR